MGALPRFDTPLSNPAPVACTMEAMQCPDGSFVSRRFAVHTPALTANFKLSFFTMDVF